MLNKILYVILLMAVSFSSLMAMDARDGYDVYSTSKSSHDQEAPLMDLEATEMIDKLLRQQEDAIARRDDILTRREEVRTQPCCSPLVYERWPLILINPAGCLILPVICLIRHCCPTQLCVQYDRLSEELAEVEDEITGYDTRSQELMRETYLRTGHRHPQMRNNSGQPSEVLIG